MFSGFSGVSYASYTLSSYDIWKKKSNPKIELLFFGTSNVLLSQAAARQVPSTLEDFTSVFGMGTGVAPPPSSLDMRKNLRFFRTRRRQRMLPGEAYATLTFSLKLSNFNLLSQGQFDINRFVPWKSHIASTFYYIGFCVSRYRVASWICKQIPRQPKFTP